MQTDACHPFGRRSWRSIGESGSKLSRATLLIGASLLVPAAPAWAANECGAPPPGGGTVTCTPAGNSYPNGISALLLVAGLVAHIRPLRRSSGR